MNEKKVKLVFTEDEATELYKAAYTTAVIAENFTSEDYEKKMVALVTEQLVGGLEDGLKAIKAEVPRVNVAI